MLKQSELLVCHSIHVLTLFHAGIAFRDVKGSNLKLFPTVGLKKSGEHIRVNFGQTPFVYDIDGMMKARNTSHSFPIFLTRPAFIMRPLCPIKVFKKPFFHRFHELPTLIASYRLVAWSCRVVRYPVIELFGNQLIRALV
jgi:hypothetical protein